MAYRVIFWKPKNGVDVWVPQTRPFGESIREAVLRGATSESLQEFPTAVLFIRFKEAFSGSTIDGSGKLYWTDELENGFVASFGGQYVEVCAFDLEDGDSEKLFEIATEEFGADYYDWGN